MVSWRSLDVAGNILPCPYMAKSVGTIFEPVNWNKLKVECAKPECLTCELYQVCGCYCHVDITGFECYIMKKVNAHFHKLMDKYNITYDHLYQVWKEPYPRL